ncbi:MAG: hypothetical protein JJT78_08930 [Leptospira sp.]|nr:hypothetical protein [Leptospira sp.]
MDQADASCLLVPALGLLPPNDPLVDKTIAEIRKQLESDGMVFRYHAKDGLAGGEGGFLLCSFWLMDALIHSGKSAEAEKILEKIFSLSNDVGLYAEEAEMKTGEQLGNFPQAFTHMALVSTCAYLTYAKEGKLPKDKAYSFAEFAVKMIAEGK